MSTDPKIAVVTGAGSGIGAATTLALLDSGFAVVLAGRRRARLEQKVLRAGPQAKRALIVQTDVSDESSVHALFETTKTTFGRVDLLFSNAGIGAPIVPLEELTVAKWRQVIDINLTGAFLCTQEAFRIMKEQNPRWRPHCQ